MWNGNKGDKNMIQINCPIWVAILLAIIMIAPSLLISAAMLFKQIGAKIMSKNLEKLIAQRKVHGIVQEQDTDD